jgi:hypothetical protein
MIRSRINDLAESLRRRRDSLPWPSPAAVRLNSLCHRAWKLGPDGFSRTTTHAQRNWMKYVQVDAEVGRG